MKIGILSISPRNYSNTQLKEAAKRRGHTVKILDTLGFSIYVEEGKPNLFLRGKPISKIDAVIPRIGSSQSLFGTAVVRQFEQKGVFCLNSSYGISIARDKLRTIQILSRHHIGFPATTFVFNRGDIPGAIARVGGAPVVIKLLQGTQGVGVILGETDRTAQAMAEALRVAQQNVLIQRFVKESKGVDIRAFVIGDKVFAAMRRKAQEGEFRSNVHLGADTEAIQLDSVTESVAIKAAHILGLRVAGVDLLEGKDGPLIMEVNASPGLEGIEGATHKDVAGAIIEYMEDQVLFPDVDVRERLALGRGYAVVEIPVSRKSELAGKIISETRLSDLGIQVLSIIRSEQPIPNPSSAELLLAGDVILCFGKQISLKTFIPIKHKRRIKNLDEASPDLDMCS